MAGAVYCKKCYNFKTFNVRYKGSLKAKLLDGKFHIEINENEIPIKDCNSTVCIHCGEDVLYTVMTDGLHAPHSDIVKECTNCVHKNICDIEVKDPKYYSDWICVLCPYDVSRQHYKIDMSEIFNEVVT